MAVKKTILKVNINCDKCKKDILKAVTKLEGIDQVAVDGEKGTLTVIGDVDPVCVVIILRKMKKVADIISVGLPKPPELKPSEPKPSGPKPSVDLLLPPSCHECQFVAVSYDSAAMCTIL